MHKKANLINRIEEACSSTVSMYGTVLCMQHARPYTTNAHTNVASSAGAHLTNGRAGWFPHPQEQLIAWLALNSCHWLRGQQGLGVPSYLGLNWSQEGKVVLRPSMPVPACMHGFLSVIA